MMASCLKHDGVVAWIENLLQPRMKIRRVGPLWIFSGEAVELEI